MTPSLEDITQNLKKLVENISSSKEKYNELVKNTHELKRQVELIKEHRETLDQMNNLSQSQPRASLIAALQDERHQALTLETENLELRSTIDNYQQSFKLMMNKFKTHEEQLKLLNEHEVNFKLPSDDINRIRCEFMQNQVNDMILVIDKASNMDAFKINQQQETISKLKADNSKFKEILLFKRKINLKI